MSKLNQKVSSRRHMSSITIIKAAIPSKRSNKFKITELLKSKTSHSLWQTELRALITTRICQRLTKPMTRRTTLSPRVAQSPRLKSMVSAGKLKETNESIRRRPPAASIHKTDRTFAAPSPHPVRKTTNSTASLTTENLSESACLLAMACRLEPAILSSQSSRR